MNKLFPTVYSFKLECIPPKATAQASNKIMKKSNGKMFVGKSVNSKAAAVRSDLITLLLQHKPDQMYRGPVRVSVQWQYPFRKSEKKKFINRGFRYCDTRPDCDNLQKLLFDCMTRVGFWKDDSQIAEVRFTKMWMTRPGIVIEIEELE